MSENLLDNISKRLPTLSKKQKKIAQTIIDDYDKAVFLTAAGLGELAGVSESTVVRFAMELGFEGYPEFHRALEELIKRELTAEQRMSATSRKLDKSSSHILKKVMDLDRSRLEKNLLELDCESFDNAVKSINSARNIYVVGGRSSYALATFFSFYLGFMKENVTMVNISNLRENFEFLIDVDERDVCVIFSFPRYFKRTVSSAMHIKKKGAKIIGITDTEVSPVANLSDIVLTSQTEMMSLVDSLVSPMSLINALLVAISLEDKENVLGRFNTLEELWTEHSTYGENHYID
ncbi:MAG: MurR/RpiR family transcriptional regulator [Lachnospirales bacterium]